MLSFSINMVLFTALLLTPMLSLLGLIAGNDLILETRGVVPATPSNFIQTTLQPAYAQEQDEETDGIEEEEEDENRSNDNDNDEEGNEDEDDRQVDSLGICCSWDERLADGILTYRIIERVNEQGDEDEEDREDEEDVDEEEEGNQDDAEFSSDELFRSDADLRRAVADAVTEWNTKIPNLNLVNDDTNADADIEVQLVDGLGGLAAGATMLRFDEDGFINKATILLPKAAFFIESDSQVFAIQYDSQKLKEIATHEMGHALGLGHTDFDSDLMSENLDSDDTVNISQCHIDGVLQANQWKFMNNDTIPNNPNEDEVSC
jgi:Matrixin